MADTEGQHVKDPWETIHPGRILLSKFIESVGEREREKKRVRKRETKTKINISSASSDRTRTQLKGLQEPGYISISWN